MKMNSDLQLMRKKHKITIIVASIILLLGLTFFGGFYVSSKKQEASIQHPEQNAGIITEEPIIESQIINLSIAQLTLDSEDIEGGYILKRHSSGLIKEDNNEYFIKKFDKETLEVKEFRTLYIETYKFSTIEEADKEFAKLDENIRNPNLRFEPIELEQIGDASRYYKTDYLYNFYSFEGYLGLVKLNNIIFKIGISGISNSINKEELTYYSKKLIEKTEKDSADNFEISATQKASPKENLKISLQIRNQSSGTSNRWKEQDKIILAWDYNFIDNEFKIRQNTDDSGNTLWVHYFYMSQNKEFLILDTCLNNSQNESISLVSKYLLLRDSLGNIYTAFAREDEINILRNNRKVCVKYIFPVLKKDRFPKIKEFNLEIKDERGTTLGKIGVAASDLSRYRQENN